MPYRHPHTVRPPPSASCVSGLAACLVATERTASVYGSQVQALAAVVSPAWTSGGDVVSEEVNDSVQTQCRSIQAKWDTFCSSCINYLMRVSKQVINISLFDCPEVYNKLLR